MLSLRSSLAKTAGCLLAILVLVSGARAETYAIDASHSNVDFTIRHIESRLSGGFTGLSGSVSYDPANPEESTVSATIGTNTIDTNNARRDGHLKSADFFHAEKYPSITFQSTGVRSKGDRLLVTGDLTMHGVTQQVVLPVEILGVGTHPMSKKAVAGFVAEVVIKRSDFGVNNWTDAAGVLGDEVTVRLNIEGVAGRGDVAMAKGNPCNPCSKANPCNPCAKGNPCNPCAKANPCNPCAK